MIDLKTLIPRIRYRTVTHISARPGLYYTLRGVTRSLSPLCVSSDTELVIEGFPRSANSTMVSSFLDRQVRPVALAHHKHHVAQLVRAAKWGIPAILLIRSPLSAVLSYLALCQEVDLRIFSVQRSSPKLHFSDVLLGWISFYANALPILDHLVLAPFHEIVLPLGPELCIRRVNKRFGTDFLSSMHPNNSPKQLGWHATPNRTRDKIIASLELDLIKMLKTDRYLCRLVDDASSLHFRILSEHERRR
jgi:hypothetical protein